MRKRKHYVPQSDARPVRRWATLLSVPLMDLKFVLEMSPELRHLKGKEFLTGAEARSAAAVATRRPAA